jgi:outer membrane protein, heavy metal efflux system
MSRSIPLCLFVLLPVCLVVVATAEPAATTAPLTLPEVFAELRAHHPALAAARAETEAARARIAQEKAWMDPKLTLEHLRDTNNPADYSELKVTYSQEIPLSGRNKLAARAAEAESAVVASQSRRREWMLLNEARTSFVRIAAADERLSLNTRLHDLLAQSASLSRQSYETGLVDQMNVLAVETDLARLDSERTELTSMRNQESARLNAMLLRPTQSAIAPLTLPEPAAPSIDVSAAVSRARAASPEIATALLETDAARARLTLANNNRSIDPEIMIAGRRIKGSGDFLSSYDTGISFSLPWLNPGRTDAARTEARRRLEATRSESAATEAEVAGMVAASHARAVAAYEQVLRYRDQLVPLARASVDAARRAYETGRSPLLPVLAAERMALETELKLTDTRAEQALACAELTFLTSQDLTP